MRLPIIILLVILLAGCQGSLAKMSESELVSYVMDEVDSEVGDEPVINSFVFDLVIHNDNMIADILKGSPECEGLLTTGKYRWVEITTESAHITAFISLDKNKIKCMFIREKFAPMP